MTLLVLLVLSAELATTSMEAAVRCAVLLCQTVSAVLLIPFVKLATVVVS